MTDARKKAEAVLAMVRRGTKDHHGAAAALKAALEALLASEPAKGAVDPEDSATWRTADGSMLVSDLVSRVMGLHPGADRLAVELAAYGAAKPRKSYATDEAPIAREHPKGEECTHYEADDGDCLTNACGGCCVTYRAALEEAEKRALPAPPDGAEVREAADRLRATCAEIGRLDERDLVSAYPVLKAVLPRLLIEGRALLAALAATRREPAKGGE